MAAWNITLPGDFESSAFTQVIQADKMTIKNGVLIFKDHHGSILRAFGPGGWLEVAPNFEPWRQGK